MAPLRGQLWPLLLVSAQNGPLPMGAPVGAKTVTVPQIQFQFLDMVVVGVGWGAAALSRWLPSVPESRLSVMEAFGRISSSTVLASSRWSHLEIWTSLRLPSFLSVLVGLGVACSVRRIGFFGTRALLGSTVDTYSTGGFGRISAFSTLR